MSAATDATNIRRAIEGIGTDDAVLIEILTSRSNQQLVEISKEYARLHGKSIVSDIKGDTSGCYQQLLLALITPKHEYMAEVLYKAMKGLGTDERALIDVLVYSSNEDIHAIKKAYNTLYKQELEKDVKGDTSGNFLAALLSLLEGNRDEGAASGSAQSDAEDLFKKGEGRVGTDDSFFIKFFTKSSAAHIQAVNAAYTAAHGHGLVEAVRKETSGSYRELLIALATPRAEYVAQRIKAAVKGLGTDDSALIRTFVLNRHLLIEAREIYSRLYNVKLESDISGDTSGNYKITLLCLLKFAGKGEKKKE